MGKRLQRIESAHAESQRNKRHNQWYSCAGRSLRPHFERKEGTFWRSSKMRIQKRAGLPEAQHFST